jgi:hypothetical protein
MVLFEQRTTINNQRLTSSAPTSAFRPLTSDFRLLFSSPPALLVLFILAFENFLYFLKTLDNIGIGFGF